MPANPRVRKQVTGQAQACPATHGNGFLRNQPNSVLQLRFRRPHFTRPSTEALLRCIVQFISVRPSRKTCLRWQGIGARRLSLQCSDDQLRAPTTMPRTHWREAPHVLSLSNVSFDARILFHPSCRPTAAGAQTTQALPISSVDRIFEEYRGRFDRRSWAGSPRWQVAGGNVSLQCDDSHNCEHRTHCLARRAPGALHALTLDSVLLRCPRFGPPVMQTKRQPIPSQHRHPDMSFG